MLEGILTHTHAHTHTRTHARTHARTHTAWSRGEGEGLVLTAAAGWAAEDHLGTRSVWIAGGQRSFGARERHAF